MKTSINKVTLQGFLGSNPEIREFAQDKSMARVALATNERYKDSQGEMVEETQWHNLVFWGKWASFAGLNLKKGLLVNITGKLVNRQYVDKDGVTRYVTEVTVSSAKVIEKQRKGK